MTAGDRYHAIYLVLNGWDFFPASLRSVYPHISGATVVTSYDRDRFGTPVEPDRTVAALLSRELDPERKVNVLVCTDAAEAVLRNRAMAFAAPPPAATAVASAEPGAASTPAPDWFWIIDADEIYDADNVARLKQYVRQHPASAYALASTSYWRSWNWRIEQRDHRVVLVRPGRWFDHLRHLRLGVPARVARRLRHVGALPEDLAARLMGARDVPREVAAFHHGDFVGDRDRIAAKLATSGHRAQFDDGWLRRVWDAWTPDMTDLHPFDPPMFPAATHVATAALPAEIAGCAWPAGWLEDR